MIGNPLQYTSRTFNTITSDINSDAELADKPNWWKRLWAGIGDILSMWLNAAVNNTFLRTSFTRQAVTDLLELIDYQITEQSTATGDIIFYITTSAIFPFTVAAADLIAFTPGSLAVSAKKFEARTQEIVSAVTEVVGFASVSAGADTFTVTIDYPTGSLVALTPSGALPNPLLQGTPYWVIRVDATTIQLATTLANAIAGTQIDLTNQGTGNHTVTLFSFQKTVFQQETIAQITAGTSDGVTEFQEFDLADINVLEDSLTVTINSLSWTRVDTLVDSLSTDRHFRLIYNVDNSSKLQFGNGTYGLIPPAFDVLADYAIGGGSDSNVATPDRINIYGGSDANVSGVSNPTAITGGDNPQSIAQAKVLGPLLLKAGNRFVTPEDGEALSLAFGGLSHVKVNENVFGVLSAQVLGVADGGGNPSSAVKTALDTFLTDRSVLSSMDIRVEDLTINTTAVTSAFKVLTGFVFADVNVYFSIAWRLLLSETGTEILDELNESGLAAAITLINTIFSTAFTLATDGDNILPLLENLEPAEIGLDLQESSVVGYLDSSVIGVDYLTVASPAFPIVVGTDEITTDGALTITEIP